jgi:hypothetical protein
MKFFKFSLFSALLVGACLPGVAQTTTTMQVNIPFNFIAAGKTLPPGHYLVAPVSESNSIAWRISTGDGGVMVVSNSVASTHKAHGPSLVFLQAGGAYSLVQIWNEQHSGREVLKSNVKQTIVAEAGKYVEIGAE